MKKPFGKTLVGGLLKGLVREGLQTVPVLGTFVTAFKENTKESPQGTIKLTPWHYYRIALGIISAVLIAKGILTKEEVEVASMVIGF